VPVPYLYSILSLLVTVWGVGAVIMVLGALNRQSRLESA